MIRGAAPRRAALLLLLALAAPAWGQSAGIAGLEGSLGRIAARGELRLGHREASVPFSYLDAEGKVTGYSHALMLRVVDAIKAELRQPELRVSLVPLTSQNRFAMVESGQVDLECGSTTHTRERARRVAFSTTLFISETRLMVPRGSPIRDFDDLTGRNVVTTAGTTSEKWLDEANRGQHLGAHILSTRDHRESFQVLEAGHADAFMLDDALLYGERAGARVPANWVVTGRPATREPIACTLRKGDAHFKRVVDSALVHALSSGEGERLYRQWFQSPIPPRDLNLDFPLSEPMKALFRAPNDLPQE